MRLTLRTLLAYLDDVLPPDQAKEMGQKLVESGYATALVDRIKEVMRRRRLAAPELMGKSAGIDPNIVAEYLDNELNPTEVADVEKICLDSDVHLAEVAASHQILTIVLGEPVEVRPELRSRMYALGPVAQCEKMRVNEASPARPIDYRPIPSVASTVATPPMSMLDEASVNYMKPKSSWKQTGLLVLLVLIIVGWVGLLMRDETVMRGLRSDKSKNENVTATGNDASDSNATPAIDSKTPVSVAQSEPQETTTNVSVEKALPKQLPAEEPNVELAAVEPARKNSAATQKVPSVEVSSVELVATDKVPTQDEPIPLPSVRLLYSSKEGVLLHFDKGVNDFVVMPRRAELKPGDRLASPDPFRADILIGEDLGVVALNGGTAVQCLAATDRASMGFDVQQGSLIFEARRPAAPVEEADNPKAEAARKGLMIAISLGGQLGWMELASDDALCGLDVRRREPSHFETDVEPPGVSAGLHVARGMVRFTNASGKTATVSGPGFLPITSDLGANLKASEIGRASQLVLPDWLESDPKRAASKLKRPYNTPFEKEFDPEQPLLLSVPAIVSNPRPAISELAVKCLALTDSYQPLVKSLINVDHREARLAAITGLRQWLPTHPQNRQALKTELGRHVLPSDSDIIYRLLWGFSPDDAKDPKKSRLLVDWLDSEQDAIRELAFWHLQRLTGLKHDYSPINPPGQRRTAVERWNMHLEKKNGSLIQE